MNSDDHILEPGLAAPLQERLEQVKWIAETFGPHALNARFDPIVHYRLRNEASRPLIMAYI